MTAPDGHIYSVPYVLSAPAVDFNPYINTRWLKKILVLKYLRLQKI